MSGNIVGGVIGAAIGYFVPGGSVVVGWLVGSTVGGLLFPTNTRGPDLTDLKPQSSEYGRPIPIVYSSMALDGTVIWAADLIKTSDGSGGGKGSESATGPTYAANFAVLICESDGTIELGRIFAGPEKRMVYDPATQAMESGSVTYYNGAEDQMPDPLMESYLGAGNVPAYRGSAYVVIEGFNVTEHDGNRIPFLTIEVAHKVNASHANLGQVSFNHVWTVGDKIYAAYYGSFFGVLVHNQDDMTFVRNRDLSLSEWSRTDTLFYDADRDNIVRANVGQFSSTGPFSYTTMSIASGTITEYEPFSFGGAPGSERYVDGAMVNGMFAFACSLSGGGTKFYLVNPATNTLSSSLTFDVGASDTIRRLYSTGVDLYVWGVSDTRARIYDLSGAGGSSTDAGAIPAGLDVRTAINNCAIDPDTGYLWCAVLPLSSPLAWSVHDASGALINSGTKASQFWELAEQPWVFVPGSGPWLYGERWLAYDHYQRFDGATGEAIGFDVDGIYRGINDLSAVIYNPATLKVVGYRVGGFYALATTDQPPALPYITGYLGDASASLQPQTLAEVVTDLSLRAGLTEADIDVTELTDTVDGFAVANQMAVKDALSALMPVYYFDAYEDQGVVVFKKRGGDIAVEIDDADLGAQEADSTEGGGDLLQINRATDEELPGTFTVSYVLAATNYSQATKYARRLVGNSGNQNSLQLPMVLTDQKAAEVAAVNLHDAWVSRMSYRFTLPRKFAYLCPTDLVGVRGYTARITKITQQASGVFVCEAVRDDADTYVPNVIVDETPPTDGTTVEQPSLTLLEVM